MGGFPLMVAEVMTSVLRGDEMKAASLTTESEAEEVLL